MLKDHDSLLWQKFNEVALPASLASLMTERGSLTARLESQLQQPIQVTLLNGAISSNHWVRDVLLGTSNEDSFIVFAQTSVPLDALKTDFSFLKGLGTTTLGSFLFQDERITRSEFTFTKVPRSAHPALSSQKSEILWARRSTFSKNDSDLTLIEVFLT